MIYTCFIYAIHGKKTYFCYIAKRYAGNGLKITEEYLEVGYTSIAEFCKDVIREK